MQKSRDGLVPGRARLHRLAPVFLARDIAAAEQFWGVLGFATIYRDADYLLVRRDEAELHFNRAPGLDPAKNECSAYLRMDDLVALNAEWRALGLPVAGIPRYEAMSKKPWNMFEAALVDIDGNLVRAGIEA